MLNQDFYPTPAHLITKMMTGEDLLRGSSILEPSAGKGDICDYLVQMSVLESNDIDVIEIEPDLQTILKEKKYRLVHDNFLTFDTYKKYDYIIANFPFSDGDQHLQKAIYQLEKYGGRLICLVNAETIRNQHSNSRTAIGLKLKALNAEIEFLEDQFVDAERKTGVEVALIKVTVPGPAPISFILEDLKKAPELASNMPNVTDLVEASGVNNLIKYFEIESKLGVNLIKEYNTLLPYIVEEFQTAEQKQNKEYKYPILELKIRNDRHGHDDNVLNSYLKELRKKYWKFLINSESFRKNFTSNILSDIYNKVEELADYDFTQWNIQNLERELRKNIVSGIEQSIIKLFDEFSHKFSYHNDFGNNIHYYNGWKANKAHKINKKVILPINGFSAYSWGTEKFDWHIEEKFEDMVKVFNYLSVEATDCKQIALGSIKTAEDIQDFKNVDFKYFTATFYKKGTCHIVFKSDKLLEKFNIFGSQKKGWLPPSYGKKTYKEMTKEEQVIVDEFQGEEKYNEVVENKSYFLNADIKLLN